MIIVLTENDNKYQEYEKILGRYGLKLRQQVPIDGRHIKDLFTEDKVTHVLRETSDVYNSHTNDFSDKDIHLESVYNLAELTVYSRSKTGKPIIERISHRIDGYVDLTRKSTCNTVFGWDDVFIVRSTQLSYHDMRGLGIKTSARDLVLSDFIRNHVFYKHRIDLKFSPHDMQETVEFGDTPIDFIKKNPFYTNSHMAEYKLDNAIRSILKGGIFFRSASNRREKNYWSPGLNGGIPLTPKKDDVHEATFMFHDMMHFLIPDLVFTGQGPKEERRVYIIYRMISEAVTLVLADMLFIDSLRKSGLEYDFSKRKIQPLFESLNFDFRQDFFGQLYTLLKANVLYALCGDDSLYRELSKDSSDDSALRAFKEKYTKFFIEDYRWTARNYDNMCQTSKIYRDWVDSVGRQNFHNRDLSLLDEFTNSLTAKEALQNDLKGAVLQIFDFMFDTIIKPALMNATDVSNQDSTSEAFKRYIIGQSLIFSKYAFASGTDKFKNLLLSDALKDAPLSTEDIEVLRKFYEAYIDHLRSLNIISEDDQTIYKQIHPLFDPFYVFYESQKLEFDTIDMAAKTLMEFPQ